MRRALSLLLFVVSAGCSSSDAPASTPGETIETPSLATRACVDGTMNKLNCTMCDGGVFVSYCEVGQLCKSGACVNRAPLGSACTSSTQCDSGFCVDGVCCSSSCGACGTCNSSGSCVARAAGSTPKTSCTKSLPGTCGAKCNGVSKDCEYPTVATTCALTAFCSGTPDSGYSYVTGTSTCDGGGTCKPPAAGGVACGNYGCTSSGCVTTCTTSAQCINSAFCVGGTCKTKLGLGVECPTPDACAATGAGTPGCAAASDGKQRCCQVTCAAPKACSIDGTACVGTTPYGGSCTADDQCATSKCAGGKCVTCKSDTDCSPADYCDTGAGKCNIRAGVGATCATAATCPTGTFCTDGVCCVASTCPDGTCAGAKKGACAKVNGTTCDKDADCDSGKCVDGVCCDSTCDGQCEACNTAGSLGKCVAVKGEPRGMRKSCAAGDGTNPCSRASCDGEERSRCAALAGSETSCRAASCLDGFATSAATCNGSGTCPDPVKGACGAYQCAPDKTCRTTCSADGDCAAGNSCRNNQCEPRVAECTDVNTSLSRDGVSKACAPYRCDTSSGNCFEGCTTSDQCGAGTFCTDGKCAAAPPGETGDDGGCSAGARGANTPSAATLIIALAALGLTRKRAARVVQPRA